MFLKKAKIMVKKRWVFQVYMRKGNIKRFAFVFFLHSWFPYRIELRKKKTFLFGVTIFCCGFGSGGFVNVFSYTFMYSSIFIWKIVIVLVIGIEMFQDSLK